MSYYTGQGDYYSGKGDPGIFGSLWGGIKGAVGGFIKGGPLGAVRGGISGALGRVQTAPVAAPTPIAATIRAAAPQITPRQRVTTAFQALLPGGVEPGMAPVGAPGAACTPGWHLNKAYSYKNDVPAGSYCVKNRSLNPANPKALRRAIRREKAFIGMARSALKGTGWKLSKTPAYARKSRRR